MNETKVCTVCNQELPINHFAFDKRYNSYGNQCRKCRWEIAKPRIAKNREAITKRQQEWVDSNRERVNENYQEWRRQNETHLSNYHKDYYQTHREKRLEDAKKYQRDNKEKIRIRKSEWTRKQRQSNPQVRIKESLRSRVRAVLRRDNITKKNTTNELIGCDFDFLKKHLESLFKEGMSWDNYGRNGWHIDHIIPCDSFDLTDIEQQKKCFHYTNLQPLWEFDNLSKGAKLDFRTKIRVSAYQQSS